MDCARCNNEQVGEFAKFVKRRNKIAHPTGTAFFNDHQAIDAEIADMMREVRNTEAHMQPVISELYRRFLTESAQAEEHQYGTFAQELSANFIHKAYMSIADLRLCATYDIDQIADLPRQDVIAGLHTEIAAITGGDEDREDA
jgi:hypothetical protein